MRLSRETGIVESASLPVDVCHMAVDPEHAAAMRAARVDAVETV
jgi:hypothetical protein